MDDSVVSDLIIFLFIVPRFQKKFNRLSRYFSENRVKSAARGMLVISQKDE
jgi:hypothetical protein